MNTFVTVVVGSVLGIAVAFLCVPRREAERIPPSWFELPGEPVAVGDQPTPTWEHVNRALRKATEATFDYAEDYYRIRDAGPRGFRGAELRITYVPRAPRGGAAPTQETVTVRPCFPISANYSRSHPLQLVHYETVHRISPE